MFSLKLHGMKIALALLLATVLLSSCSSFAEEGGKYVGLVRLYLAQFGELQNTLSGYIARTAANPGILKVDETFRRSFGDCIMSTSAILFKMTDLKPSRDTEAAHEILINASEHYQSSFTEMLLALDNWTPDTTSKIQRLSNDANVTFNTYLTRIPK